MWQIPPIGVGLGWYALTMQRCLVRASLLFALSTSCLLAASSAYALNQPDGTPIPQGNGLQGLFDVRGEAINALASAAAVPETFQPSCSLTFEVLQRNAGYQNAFGWYNVTGSLPSTADLHEFIHCSDPIGTSTPLPNIQNDPAYLGGQIGFYEGVVTGGCGPTTNPNDYAYVFYSEKALNPDSNQAKPFVHLLVYNSTVTPNAFYFGWEDLIAGGDNDFDDLTTFVTGITCAGGGGECQTGQPGVCGPGTLQCQNGVLACLPLMDPSDEVCDGFDNDCNGSVDDGDLCMAGEVCDNGNCVPNCGSGEFTCPSDKVCDEAKGICVEPACEDVDCPDGTKCIGGNCVDPCTGVVCPVDQVCLAGNCLNPCDAIICDAAQVCDGGACIDKCQCAGCPNGETCEASGLCVLDACVGVDCPEGGTCQPDGTCADGCAGVVCPAGQACLMGECVPDTSGNGGSGGAGGGLLVGGGTQGGGGESNGGNGGSSSGGSNAGGSGGAGGGSSAGCDCTVGAANSQSSFLGLAGLAGLAMLVGRRRRAHHRPGKYMLVMR